MGWFSRNEHDEEQLSAYVDGALTARQAEKVERHVSSCSTCQALLEDLRQTRALLLELPTDRPRRSFVLGAEHARPPEEASAAPSRRFGLAWAPAVALSVFVALVFVDLAGFSSTASDESTGALSATTLERAAVDDQDKSTGASAAQSSVAEGGDSSGEGVVGGQEFATGAAASAGGPNAGTTATDGQAPEVRGESEAPPPGEAEAGIVMADAAAPQETAPLPAELEAPLQETAPAPAANEAPLEESDEGVSTLRILQVVAAAGVLVSGFYVFVRPRLLERGS